MNKTDPGEDLVNRVRTALAAVPDVTERKMFGSVGFMVRGHLCVSARAERIMCRIDPAQHSAALQRKGCQTVVMKGRPYQGYVYVDADVLATKKALSHWIEQALEYSRKLTPKSQ